ncbi:hypothetical protein Pfo_030086 [Paulownia fortunei]|nr:hypothetical protein Pfo_030086 [Paulownia fortunei]
MDFFALVTVLVLIAWTCFHILRSDSRHRRAAKLPPGPYPFPIVGNIHQLGQKPHQSLAKLPKTFGPLIGRAVNIGEVAFITTLNLMSATLFSAEFAKFDSDAAQEFKETAEGVEKVLGVANISDYFPILKPIDPQGIKRKAEFYFGKLLAMIEDIINQRLQSRGTSLASPKKNDLLETLLDLSQGSEYELTSDDIKHLLLDLFVAGSDTTEWTMTEFLLNPEKLSKAKQEFRTVIGENKQEHESDISRLPYFQAVIKEVFRYHPPGPHLIPRKSEYDVEVSGYRIPKGTQILVNVWAMGREPSLWSNPNSF